LDKLKESINNVSEQKIKDNNSFVILDDKKSENYNEMSISTIEKGKSI